MQWAHNTGYSTLTSRNFKEAHGKTLSLYRDCLKAIPTIKEAYQIVLPDETIKNKFRREFQKNASVTEVEVIDRLTFVGLCELADTMKIYKTRAHVMNRLVPDTVEATKNIAAEDELEHFFHKQGIPMNENMRDAIRSGVVMQ